MEAIAVLLAVVVIALVVGMSRNKKGRCRRCRKRVSVNASVCPYCGNEFS